MSIFKDLRTMHKKFGFEPNKEPDFLPDEYMEFRVEFVQEEFIELVKAVANKDLPETIDALIDIMVVAAGTLDLMGVDSQKHWDEVHFCNMQKQVGVTKRKFGADLMKPHGWKGPNHQRILEEK